MLTAPACHPTKFVNKAEQQTFLSTNIGDNQAIYLAWNIPFTIVEIFIVQDHEINWIISWSDSEGAWGARESEREREQSLKSFKPSFQLKGRPF